MFKNGEYYRRSDETPSNGFSSFAFGVLAAPRLFTILRVPLSAKIGNLRVTTETTTKITSYPSKIVIPTGGAISVYIDDTAFLVRDIKLRKDRQFEAHTQVFYGGELIQTDKGVRMEGGSFTVVPNTTALIPNATSTGIDVRVTHRFP